MSLLSQKRTDCLQAMRVAQTEACGLPAIATVAAISAAPPAVAASATATSAAAITAPPAAAAFRLRTRFVDHQVSAPEVLAVQRINRPVRVFVTVDFDEREPA